MGPSLLMLLAVVGAAQPAPGTDAVVAIDRAWLAQRGPGPYLLDQPRTTYLLQTDVRTEASAFVVDAANVVLDLGGHRVVYGDSAPLTVENGGFERGSGRDVPGWDLSGASAATIAANTNYLFGKQVLRLQNFRDTQRLVSAPVAVRATTHTHVATVTPSAGDYRTTLTLTVVDADSGKVLGKGKSNNVERGISAVTAFQPGDSKAVRLVLEATPGEGRCDSLDLDEATVSASYDYGIVASNTWTGDLPGWSNLAATIPTLHRQVSNFTLCNGSVRAGRGRGVASSPLWCNAVRGLTVQDVQMFTNGMDTSTIEATWASGPLVIRRCKLEHDVPNITDRGRMPSAIRLAATKGAIDVEDNELSDVPQVGILLDGATSGASIHIRRNRIALKGVVTNGYAIAVTASRNFEIADNRILAENGRGIDIDSYRKDPVADSSIHHNHVEVRERLNREYRDRVEARALRLRCTSVGNGPHRNLSIHDNTLIATTADGLAQDAFAVIITYQNTNGSMTDANVRLEHNTLRAITTRSGADSHASALDLDGLDANVGLSVKDNILESNDVALTLANTQGPVAGVRLLGNTFRRIKEGPERPFHAIRTGFWEHTVRDAVVIGPHLEGHDVLDIDWVGTGRKDVAVGHLLNVSVQSRNVPAVGASIVVEDREGKAVFTGKTDANGSVLAIPLVTVRSSQTTGDSRKIISDERGPFRVHVEANGQTTVETLQLRDNQEITVSLPDTASEK